MKKKDLKEGKLSILEKAKVIGITLKKIKSLEMRRGVASTADVYLNGKLLAHANDEGYGGGMDIDPAFKNENWDERKANQKLIQEVEAKLAEYPEYTIEHVGHSYQTTDTLECIICALMDDFETQKIRKREEKKGIVVDGSIIHWNSGSLPNMIKKFGKERTLDVVQKKCDALAAEKTEILNKDYLKSIGIKI